MKIALVFRSGGDYNASDVQWLVGGTSENGK